MYVCVDEEIPPLYVKHFECMEKRYINKCNELCMYVCMYMYVCIY